MIKKKDLSKEDRETWDNFTKDPLNIYDKDKKNRINITRKDRLTYDLHGFTLEEANKKVREIILSKSYNKYKEILLITGKGLHSTTDNDTYISKDLSKLKYSVPEYIYTSGELNQHIISISEASHKDGGSGAILMKLTNL